MKMLTGRGSESITTKSSFWTKALSRSMNGVKRANRMRAWVSEGNRAKWFSFRNRHQWRKYTALWMR